MEFKALIFSNPHCVGRLTVNNQKFDVSSEVAPGTAAEPPAPGEYILQKVVENPESMVPHYGPILLLFRNSLVSGDNAEEETSDDHDEEDISGQDEEDSGGDDEESSSDESSSSNDD